MKKFRKFIVLMLIFICMLVLSSCSSQNAVFFETNGGTPIEPQITNKIEKSPSTLKEGFVLEGWFKDEAYTKKVEFPFRAWKTVKLYAKWKQINFTVDYQTDGGSIIETEWVDCIESCPQTNKDGYVLEGWYVDPDFENLVEFPFDVTEDITLYAKWRQVNFTVTFQTNGGSKMSSMWTDCISASPRPTRTGYAFEGWYADPNFEKIVEFPFDVTEDIELYAKWRQVNFTVTFQTNGGSKISSMWTDSISTPPRPTRTGYVFEGWYKDKTLVNPAAFPLKVIEDVTLYAKWKKVEFNVRFEENGGSSVSDVSTDCLTSSPHTYKDGYAFGGWYNDPTFVTRTAFPVYVTKNTTLYAKWLITKYSVSYNGVSIKALDSHYYSGLNYKIDPLDFDLDELSALGYRNVTITITFKVHFTKSYDVLLNIGYLGAPKYDISINNENVTLKSQKNITATTSITQKSISYTASIFDLKKDKMFLKIETDNIQNVVHISDIIVDFECTK